MFLVKRNDFMHLEPQILKKTGLYGNFIISYDMCNKLDIIYILRDTSKIIFKIFQGIAKRTNVTTKL